LNKKIDKNGIVCKKAIWVGVACVSIPNTVKSRKPELKLIRNCPWM